MHLQTTNRITTAQKAPAMRTNYPTLPPFWIPPPFHLHTPSFMHPSIPGFSKPAVCDFPHMQSWRPLCCFVFKEEDCLSKPREIAKHSSASSSPLSSIQTRSSFSLSFFFLPLFLSLLSLCASQLLISLNLSNTAAYSSLQVAATLHWKMWRHLKNKCFATHKTAQHKKKSLVLIKFFVFYFTWQVNIKFCKKDNGEWFLITI